MLFGEERNLKRVKIDFQEDTGSYLVKLKPTKVFPDLASAITFCKGHLGLTENIATQQPVSSEEDGEEEDEEEPEEPEEEQEEHQHQQRVNKNCFLRIRYHFSLWLDIREKVAFLNRTGRNLLQFVQSVHNEVDTFVHGLCKNDFTRFTIFPTLSSCVQNLISRKMT